MLRLVSTGASTFWGALLLFMPRHEKIFSPLLLSSPKSQ